MPRPLSLKTLDDEIAALEKRREADKVAYNAKVAARKAAQDALDRKRDQEVGRLARATGLADIPDDILEKFFLAFPHPHEEMLHDLGA